MAEDTLPPEEQTTHDLTHDVSHEQIMDQLLPLRDRIVKIETIINYHDKEFQTVKNSIGDLTKTVERNQDQLFTKLDLYNKNYMDVLYEQFRENTENSAEIVEKINTNKHTFESYVAKWRAVTWAVWFTICITLTAVGWGISTAHDLGFFDVNKINAAQEIHSRIDVDL